MSRQVNIKSTSNRESLDKVKIRPLQKMIWLRKRKKEIKSRMKTKLRQKKLSYVWLYQGLKCHMNAKPATLP
jgi:hypothetical protein